MSDLDPTTAAALAKMELRIVREIQRIQQNMMTEDRVKEIVGLEIGYHAVRSWSVRSAIAAVGGFLVLISSFVYTIATRK